MADTAREKPQREPTPEERRMWAAEAAKLEAEAASIVAHRDVEEAQRKAEIQRLEFETIKQQTELAQLRAFLRTSEATAQVAAIAANFEAEKEQERLASDEYNCVYTFSSAVDGASVAHCIKRLTTWMRLRPKAPITIIFDSPGGSVIDGMALFDFIQYLRGQGHYITTVALGYAASMAGILLQAGDHRVMGREAYLLVHEVSTGAFGKIGEIEDEVAFVKKIQRRILNIFAERSTLSVPQLEKRWKRHDWWLDSTEALKLRFIDEVGYNAHGGPGPTPVARRRKQREN